MNNRNYYYNILEGQYSTEKSVGIAEKNKGITFRVAVNTNKILIRDAVEKIFNVKVSYIRVINVRGKIVKFKNIIGRKKKWKKAIVFLKKGFDINFGKIE